MLGPVPGTNRPLVGTVAFSGSSPASMPYFSIKPTSCAVSPGRVPRFAITQRPSFVCTMDGCGVTPSRAWRQVWRCTSERRITQVIRSTSVDFATASWTAHDRYWPFPVRQR